MTSLAHLRSPAVQQKQQQQQRSLVAGTSKRGGSSMTSTIVASLSSSSISSPRPGPLRRRSALPPRRRQQQQQQGPATTSHSRSSSSSVIAARAAKPMPAWDGIYGYVTKRNLETVSPREAFELASKKGWVVVDVRPRKRHEQSAPDLGEGIASVPLYDTPDFSKPSLARYLRAAMLASQGVAPVEQNEDFVDKILELLNKRKGLLMLCEVGGSLTPTVSFPTGKTSRSLQAAFRALEAGVEASKVKHVGGGCFAYSQEEGLPMTAEYDASGVGRTPGVVRQQQQQGERK